MDFMPQSRLPLRADGFSSVAGERPMANGDGARAATRKVRVGDANIHLTAWGAGPPVLLLHGNPDSGIMWEGIADRLAPHYRCIAPDLPGFGHSEVPSRFQPSLEGMAQFVEQLLDAAAIARPVDLVAHDFGGPFAFAWAIKHPDAVRRMVVINTLFFSDYDWHFWARIWRTPILGELSMLAMSRPMFAQELRRGSKGISQAHIDRTWALITPRMKKEVLRLYRAADPANFKPWEDDFLALTQAKPTLVIWGDKDPYVAPRFAERFNARKVVHLAQTGHWAPVEAPAECADAIAQFLSAT
jgi:pimeloyl-ACP methyl ester carboxylesterase